MKPAAFLFASMALGMMMTVPLAFAEADPIPPPKAIQPNGFELPPLPYAQEALEPHISARTMSFHYGKHHQAYVDNLNKLVAGTRWAGQPLETVIRENAAAVDKAVFNNAAQVWNHTCFWNSMKPGGGGKPKGSLLAMIEGTFGNYETFRKEFVNAAAAQFGSGYVWLVQDGKKVAIEKTANAETPIAFGKIPLLTCDVWEHAYYLDYQNKRKEFVEVFLDHLVNWEFAQSQLK